VYTPYVSSNLKSSSPLTGLITFKQIKISGQLVSDVRTFGPLVQGISLNPGAGKVWKRALEYELSEEGMFYSNAFVVVNFFRSVAGWIFLELAIRQGGIFTRRSEENETKNP
jgi:hypothetical protein